MVDGARLFTDSAHLQHHGGKDVGIGHGCCQAGAGGHFLLDFVSRGLVEIVARCAAYRVQSLDQRNASRKHGRERTSPASHTGFFDQHPEDGELEHGAIHELLNALITFPGLHEKVAAAADYSKNQPPVLNKVLTDTHDDQRRCRKVGSERGKDFLEGWDHENHDDRYYDKRHDHD